MSWLKKAFRQVAKPFEKLAHSDAVKQIFAADVGAAVGLLVGGPVGALAGGAMGYMQESNRQQARDAAKADAANAERIAQAMSTQPAVISNAPAAQATSADAEASDMNAETARRRRYSMASTAGAGSALRRYAQSMSGSGSRTTLA